MVAQAVTDALTALTAAVSALTAKVDAALAAQAGSATPAEQQTLAADIAAVTTSVTAEAAKLP